MENNHYLKSNVKTRKSVYKVSGTGSLRFTKLKTVFSQIIPDCQIKQRKFRCSVEMKNIYKCTEEQRPYGLRSSTAENTLTR